LGDPERKGDPGDARGGGVGLSRSNAEIVRDAFDWWNEDRESFIEIVDPEVEISVASSEVTGGVPFMGHEGYRRWIATMEESFEVWELRPVRFEECSGTVVVLGTMRLRGRGSGLELEQEMGWLVDLRDGKLLRLRSFLTHAEALGAAGAA
jgi:ketosteroid isomerase-like protein